MIEHSQDITKLAEALNLAQAEMGSVAKDAVNPHFRNKYASLEAVIETAKPALNKHGITFTQAPGALVENAVEITTMLMHKSGQWIRSTLHMPVVKRDPQGVGSAITYGLRYSLMAVLGVPPTDDDDGERAMDRRPAQDNQPKDTRTPSKKLADEMIGFIGSRPSLAHLNRFLASEQFKSDFASLDQADKDRVDDAETKRRGELEAA